MENGQEFVELPSPTEVPMVDPEAVRTMRELHGRGWGLKRIAKELFVARNTVRRYVRGGKAADRRARESRCALDEQQRAEAVRLLDGPAAGNAVVVARLLREQGVSVSVRTVERAVAQHRRDRRAAEAATVRFETAPGEQMQIDFGEKHVSVAGAIVKLMLFVAVLSYSRRIFVRAFLAQRQDDWREGVSSAFRHFGGVVERLLIDNPKAMVLRHVEESGTVHLHPDFAAFCRDQGVDVRACRPYRARTKGKVESGVKYVKRNGLAGLSFASFAELEAHLANWCVEADGRVHGTTHEVPRDRFETERTALRPLPSASVPVRERRMKRRVATDCLVDVDTVRYSVPHQLVRRHVEVLVEEECVRIFHGGKEVALHRRSRAPHARVVDSAHWAGLWRRQPTIEEPSAPSAPSVLASAGRSLGDYAAVVEEARHE